jgi:tetratricopeptide (TPR) repeat protein
LEQRSVDYYARASVQSQRVFATDEALRYVSKAISLNRESSKLPELYEQQGDLLTFRQQHEQAGIAYREALIACPQPDWLRRARLHRKHATVFARVNNDLSEQAMLLSENSLGQVTDLDAQYWNEWMEAHLSRLRTSYWRWNADEMTALLDELAPVVAVHGNVWQKAEYMDCIIRRNDVRSRFAPDDQTIQLAQERMQLLNDTCDLNASAQGHSTLGFVLFFARRFDDADRHLRQAVEKASQTGDHTILLISLCYLSLTHRCQGRVDEVRSDTENLAAALAKSSIPDYEGIVLANRAWLAYKTGHKSEAVKAAREAREVWASRPNSYPAQWPALSVSLACAVEDQDEIDALLHAQTLLQNALTALEAGVTTALQTVVASNRGPGQLLPLCRRAVDAMHKAGYL